jgi:hypothetical protein
MPKFFIGEKVCCTANDHESGTVLAVFTTSDGNFRYAERYGALQFFDEEKLVLHQAGKRAH